MLIPRQMCHGNRLSVQAGSTIWLESADRVEAHPKERPRSRRRGGSSGALVALPQTARPPTGSIPMPPPQDRKRRVRSARVKCALASSAVTYPISTVSRVSPARQAVTANQARSTCPFPILLW